MTARDLRQGDLEARRLAQSEYSRPVVLEAGAGTGKTTTLIARILAWILDTGWKNAATEPLDDETVAAQVVGGVAAITFTEAAAAEMSGRLAAGLAAIADGKAEAVRGLELDLLKSVDEEQLVSRAVALLGQLDRITICTIHAYCRGLLADHALEAELHPTLNVDADGTAIEEAAREAVEDLLRNADPDSKAGLFSTAALGLGPRTMAEGVAYLTGRGIPPQALQRPAFTGKAWSAACEELLRSVDAFRAAAAQRLREVSRGNKAIAVANGLAATEALLEEDSMVDDVETIERMANELTEAWSDSSLRALDQWSKNRFSQSELQAFGSAQEAIRSVARPLLDRLRHLRSLQPHRYETVRRAIAPLCAETRKSLHHQGVLGFDDLLLAARDLLETDPAVLAKRQRLTAQLLVDEFQDTDAVQCRIVERLALDGPRERRPGLFVVGDPKQSIYGWRSADLRSYEKFLHRVRKEGGEVRALVRNFRSAPPILEAVEHLVRPVMLPEPGMQPEFVPLLTTKKTRSQTGYADHARSPVEYWISWSEEEARNGGGRTSADEAAAIEARAIARDLSQLSETAKFSWRDAAILLRSTGRLETFLEALRQAGIPFAVTRDKQYFRRREIIEAAALIRLIVSPYDQLALTTVLRSPWVGVPDAALLPLWLEDLPYHTAQLGDDEDEPRLEAIAAYARTVAESMPDEVPGLSELHGWDLNLTSALTAIGDLRRAFAAEPADRLVEKLRRSTLIEATQAARYLGHYRVANVERLLRHLESELERSSGDVQAILRSLRRSVGSALEAEEARPQDSTENAVQVMTIHKAKGLEFEHVYLPQLHAKSRAADGASFDAERGWDRDGPREFILHGLRSLNFDRIQQRRRLVEAAEQVRTLYVALTRARQRLVLLGRLPARRRAVQTVGTPTMLDLLLQSESFPSDLQGLGQQLLAAPTGVERNGLRWRLPALTAESGEPVRHRELPRLPTAKRVEQDGRRLREMAALARRRMDRPRIGSPSKQRASDAAQSRRPDGQPDDIVAALAGEAIHRALERWDLEAEVQAERRHQLEQADRWLGGQATPEALESTQVRVRKILDRWVSGELLPRLREAGDAILARELPVLIPPAGNEDDEPLIGYTGIVDLLLGGTVDGDPPVVVDFKTDMVETEEELAARAERYRPQLELYGRALHQALHLAVPPRLELWFLWPDRVWPLSHEGDGG